MNVVFLFSDQHNPFFSGCYGSRITRTPAIDSIAERGVRFENAYCASPLCVPTRAAMFTGRYVHEVGTWDNALAWTGSPRGWSHYFRDSGVRLTTVGKLDFKPGVDHGIEDERLAIHRGSLDIHSLFREQEIVPRYSKWRQMQATRPRDDYPDLTNDDRVEREAVRWLREDRPKDRPWVLNINFTNPHPGWAPPPELWDYYEQCVRLEDLPEKYFESPDKLHPYHRAFARHQCGDIATDEDMRRGHIGYHATCEIVDGNVGRVLDALAELGILDETLVLYASDHGETCRAHASWGKMMMYEDSIRIPLVVMGPGVRTGAVEPSPVSQLDLFPTICEATGLPIPEQFRGLSLWGQLTGQRDVPHSEFVLSEYHANGFPGGAFAIRSGRHKYVECVGERPMLFDLQDDPQELHDLVVQRPDDAQVRGTVRRLRGMLCQICSPEGVDVRAKADQRALRAQLLASGQLVEEMHKRGYEKVPDRLITRKEILPDGITV